MEKINLKGVSFKYPERTNCALSDITLSVSQGELCAVIGKSASGKSTLLRLLKDELAPFGTLDGKIKINGSVGFVMQNFEEGMVTNSVLSELEFAPANAGLSADEIQLLVAECAAYFNLEKSLNADISALSGGKKQILALASVMIMKPDILVLDEPASQLDPVAKAEFFDILRSMHKDFNTTIVLATHNAENVFDIADTIAVLDDSKLLIKDEKNVVVNYLKEQNNPLLFALPARVRYGKINKKELPIDDSEPSVAIKAKNICFAYEKGADVLNALNFKAYKNKINAIIGCNAGGKTTLLKVLCGVKSAYRGSVKSSGKISMLTQNVYNTFTKDTCGEEVQFGDLTDYLEISDIKDFHPYDISGGQAQRLALSKVLATGADIILLDEPTTGLDCVMKKKLGELLKDLCTQGKTVILVTHDLEFAGNFADYTSFLSGGKIVSTMKTGDLFRRLTLYTTPLSRLTDGEVIADFEVGESV